MANKMPKEKAVQIMKTYSTNRYNKKETLIENGYAETTAKHKAGEVIDTASKVVKEALNLDQGMSDRQVSKTVLEIVGMSSDDVLEHYKFVVEQERDLPSKLKALAPLLRAIGVHLEESVAQTVIPVLNIGVTERIGGSTEPLLDSMSDNTHCATSTNGYMEGVPLEGEGQTDENSS